MKAVIVPVGEMPRVEEIEPGYRAMQAIVGGHIDACGWVFGDAPTLYVNDEGKSSCAPNRAVYATEEDAGKKTWGGETIECGDLLDIICGDFIAVGFDAETGEERDITEEEVEKVMARFGSPESIESGLMEALRIKLGR